MEKVVVGLAARQVSGFSVVVTFSNLQHTVLVVSPVSPDLFLPFDSSSGNAPLEGRTARSVYCS